MYTVLLVLFIIGTHYQPSEMPWTIEAQVLEKSWWIFLYWRKGNRVETVHCVSLDGITSAGCHDRFQRTLVMLIRDSMKRLQEFYITLTRQQS